MRLLSILVILVIAFACNNETEKNTEVNSLQSNVNIKAKLKEYKVVDLKTDLSHLSENQIKMLSLLIDASKIMDELFWIQSYGNKDSLLNQISDADLKRFVEINYGPWDRLNGDKSFISGISEKPKGANYYPVDMTKEEFESCPDPEKASLYTILRRNDAGELFSIPFNEAYKEKVSSAASLLRDASNLAEDSLFRNYLSLRADALLTDEYLKSDMVWMDTKDNLIDVVIGPIENYEDQLYNYKTAYEAYVLIKDVEWSKKLEKYISFLPELQEGLPVAQEYKNEEPGTDSDLNAYDVIYYAGHCNAGGKTIAINLPNDEEVQLNKGTRRLQLKNAMKAKFDEILVPISEVLIDSSQIGHITFDAFFANTMFHEVAHGLGIKNTITGKGPVRKALKEKASAIEEGKADILGLYMVSQLYEKGELPESNLMDYYVTFMAGIFRSIRFGSSSAHGVANLIRFNFFKEMNAFEFNPDSKTYMVNVENFESAVAELSRVILELQGNGDYDKVLEFVETYGKIDNDLKSDLDRVNAAGIPKDIVFNQGKEVLGI